MVLIDKQQISYNDDARAWDKLYNNSAREENLNHKTCDISQNSLSLMAFPSINYQEKHQFAGSWFNHQN